MSGDNLSFRPIQFTGQTAPQIRPPEELLLSLNPNLPNEFVESAHRTAGYIAALDHDPDTAIAQPDIRTFVGEVAHSGFINAARQLLSNPESPFPSWLQPGFLENHGLTPRRLLDHEQQEIDRLFAAAAKPFPFSKTEYGTYYEVDRRTGFDPSNYKCYVEYQDLLSMLRNNKLPQLLGQLADQGISPDSFKLSDSDRLVFYFQIPLASTGEGVKDTFRAQGVAFRGPAQDVFDVIEQNGQLRVVNATSNDWGLGEGSFNPNHYEMANYDPGSFIESYLKLCLFAGKDPAEPYRTSFVYLLNSQPVDATVLEQAQRLAGYPVVAAPSRRSLALLS